MIWFQICRNRIILKIQFFGVLRSRVETRIVNMLLSFVNELSLRASVIMEKLVIKISIQNKTHKQPKTAYEFVRAELCNYS